MPAIPQHLLDSVVYLYPSLDDAKAGEKIGGSGFIVEVPRDEGLPGSLYCVTNTHVVEGLNEVVVRLNTQDGATDFLPLPPGDKWAGHRSSDVAVYPIGLSSQHHQFSAIPWDQFIPEEEMGGVSPGDEVFLLGRFITHDGKQRNLPTVRFGHVAMLPHEPVPTERGEEEGFLVEVLSLSGYSGSPVLVFRLSSGNLSMFDPHMGGGSVTVAAPRLLGVDWGFLRTRREAVRNRHGEKLEGLHVIPNAGMTGVVPAWKLTELLLQSKRLTAMRDEETKILKEARKISGLASADDESGSEFERFQELTNKLLKVPKTELDEKLKDES